MEVKNKTANHFFEMETSDIYVLTFNNYKRPYEDTIRFKFSKGKDIKRLRGNPTCSICTTVSTSNPEHNTYDVEIKYDKKFKGLIRKAVYVYYKEGEKNKTIKIKLRGEVKK